MERNGILFFFLHEGMGRGTGYKRRVRGVTGTPWRVFRGTTMAQAGAGTCLRPTAVLEGTLKEPYSGPQQMLRGRGWAGRRHRESCEVHVGV